MAFNSGTNQTEYSGIAINSIERYSKRDGFHRKLSDGRQDSKRYLFELLGERFWE